MNMKILMACKSRHTRQIFPTTKRNWIRLYVLNKAPIERKNKKILNLDSSLFFNNKLKLIASMIKYKTPKKDFEKPNILEYFDR